ncbi:MAG: hypothetical protein LBD80_00320 [Tannerella sp.]|jgi:hypothetical protein|nr:hypothetical protein [Tannerella sp.]
MDNSLRSEPADIPYLESGKKLLAHIFDALRYIVDADIENISEDELEAALETRFDAFYSEVTDPHLSKGNKRLPKVLLSAWKNVQEDSELNKGFCIPSPLGILYQMLTVPEEPQSAAYVILFCRSLLYEIFEVFPGHPFSPNDYTPFDFSEISSRLDTFTGYTKKHKNISETKNDLIRSMLAHYLALKSVFYLRFKDKDDVRNYLEAKKISTLHTKIKVEFHKFTYYNDLPDASSLMNELSGIPIPIKGIDTIFQGGLKTNSKSNLVMRISGQPGSGKTSFALALAAAMSPFGAFSCYISLEEEPEDLICRLHSLIPEYLKKLSVYNNCKEISSWFGASMASFNHNNTEESAKTKIDDFIEEYLERIYGVLQVKQYDRNLLPLVCPLIIVIDNIRPFRNLNFEKFINKCRLLKALIILISPNEEQFRNDIDYMVDVVINLKHDGTAELKEKPVRILQLLKTRHQIARQGSHVFHMSGENGIHISPQLPSQTDKKEIISKLTPSDIFYINFFNEYNNIPAKHPDAPNVPIWDKSQILFHGYGSTGKAGLALTILLYPLLKEKVRKGFRPQMKRKIPQKRKVLVVSMLYPEKYYIHLEKEIKNTYQKINNHSKIDCLCFYSSHLSPEDFINKILEKLDTAILEGEPFTGILLDGLHNATLQFPKLQESNMVWFTLYSLLAKYHLTIATAFTKFLINDENRKDDKKLPQGEELLLNIMIQAADYSFCVRQLNENDYKQINHDNAQKREIKEGRYVISLESAIRHRFGAKPENFLWNKEEFLLEEYPPANTKNTSYPIIPGLFDNF